MMVRRLIADTICSNCSAQDFVYFEINEQNVMIDGRVYRVDYQVKKTEGRQNHRSVLDEFNYARV